MEGFSESLYQELEPFGIQVVLVEPGVYKTEIFYNNAKYAKRFDNPQSPYYEQSQFLKKRMMSYVGDSNKDIEQIAITIEKIIDQRNPSLRNFPDIESKLQYALRKILPFWLYNKIYRQLLFSGYKG